MSNPLRSFDLLLRIKRRRIDQYEEQAAQQLQEVRAAEQQKAEKEQAEQAARQEEASCSDKIMAMLGATSGFRPSDLVTMRHVLETLADKTKRAMTETQQAERQVQVAEEALQQTRAAIRRAEQQLEQLRERREKLARELELAAEDVQDEESEEAAVARLVATAREELLFEG